MTIHTKSRCTPHLAVVHNDVDAYHQWTTHFLILHLYTLVLQPIFSFAIHPYLQLAFVLWLSLPRTQGALFIYNKILLPLLDRYERKVDDRIDVVKGELWRMALSSMMSTGFGAANQLGLFLRIVWSGASNPLPYENVENVGHGNVQEHSLTKEEGARKKDPQHSVQDSLSSIRNCDDSEENMNEEEMLTYVRDFVEMLRKGLFVFARIMDNKEVESFSPSIPSDEKNGEKEKKFKLKVFSYEEDIQSFFISPVGSDAIEDSVAIPLNDVEFVASGPQGVAFHLLDGTITAEIVLSDAQDRETLLEGLSVYLALLSKDSDDNSKMGDAEADEDSGSLSATSLEGSVDGSVILPEAMSCNNSDGDVSTNDAERDCNALSLLEKPDDDNVNMGNVESIITPDEGETSAELQTGPDQNSDNADRDEVETSLHHESDIPASELGDNNTTASDANSDRVENMDDISLASSPGPEASELHQTKDTDVGISGGGDQCMADCEDLGLNDRNSDRDEVAGNISHSNSDGDVSTNDAERDCNALSLLEKPDDDNVNMGNVESISTTEEGEKSAELQTGPGQNSDNADRDEVETSLHHESDIPASELDDNNTTASEANSDRVENMDDISLASTPGPEASELHQTKDTDDGISGGGDQCMAELEAGSDNKESTSPEKKSVEYLVRI